MRYKFVLVYDRVEEDDPLQEVILAILNAEPIHIVPILHTTIQFTLDIDGGETELIWVMNRIIGEINTVAYAKIYQYEMAAGPGKIFSTTISSQDDNKYIGSSFQEQKHIALTRVKSFRGKFTS
jgi:hypothetical protein